jgi:hypothetical protein
MQVANRFCSVPLPVTSPVGTPLANPRAHGQENLQLAFTFGA